MTVKPLCILPDPILRQKSKLVEAFDSTLHSLIQDMFDTMYCAQGIGLAAIQIGIALRVIVIDLAKEEEKAPQVFINPTILSFSTKRSTYNEGCLSIPDYVAEVERPSSLCLAFFDEKGKKQEISAEGLFATCLQHEIDHLNGLLFIDHISKLKRDTVIRKFKKQARRKSLDTSCAS